MASMNLPQSAKDQLIIIKTVHHGKHGATAFAILKGKEHANRRALRVVKPGSLITKALTDSLKAIQDDNTYPLTKILEHDQDMQVSWYTMTWFQGYNVSYMIANHYSNGFPPFLVFRVLNQVYSAEQRLQERGLCHVDLRNGENVMLRPWSAYGESLVPKVTLIDYSGVKPYETFEAGHVLEEFILLARRMTGGERRVPDHYRRIRGERGGKAYPDRFLIEVATIYDYVATWVWHGNQMLKSFWDHNQTGLRVSALVDEMMDKGMLEELTGWLSRPKVLEGEIVAGVAAGGLNVV